MFRSSGHHRLREDAGVGAAVEAGEHDAVALGVEQRDRERLVATSVGKRIEADHADLLDASLGEPLELVMQPVQRLHPLRDRVEATELAIEQLVQADALALSDKPAEPPAEQRVRPLQPRDPEDERDDGDGEHDDEGGNGLGIEGHSRRSIRGRVSSSSRGKEAPRTRALPPGRRGVPPGLRRPSGGTRAGAALTPGCHQPHDALWIAHGNLARGWRAVARPRAGGGLGARLRHQGLPAHGHRRGDRARAPRRCRPRSQRLRTLSDAPLRRRRPALVILRALIFSGILASSCGAVVTGNATVERAYAQHLSAVEVTAQGTVTRLLADDTGPSGTHQRFIVQVSGSSQTLLIDNNVDIGKRVPVTTGDGVTVHGEYVWNGQGGLVHFTHHDPAHTHEDGWIEMKGVRYS